MELSELTAKLETVAGGKELAEAVVSMIESEKQRGIQETGKRNKENQHLRKFKSSLEALGYDEGVDLDGFTANLVQKVNTKPVEDINSKLTLKSLNDQIQKLTNDLQNERKVSKTKTIQAKLSQGLSDKFYGSDLLIRSLVEDNKVDLDNDEVIFKFGENVMKMDEGIKHLAETRKDIVKNNQVQGSRTTNNTTPRTSNDITKLMEGSPEEIKANLNEIKKHFNIV